MSSRRRRAALLVHTVLDDHMLTTALQTPAWTFLFHALPRMSKRAPASTSTTLIRLPEVLARGILLVLRVFVQDFLKAPAGMASEVNSSCLALAL